MNIFEVLENEENSSKELEFLLTNSDIMNISKMKNFEILDQLRSYNINASKVEINRNKIQIIIDKEIRNMEIRSC